MPKRVTAAVLGVLSCCCLAAGARYAARGHPAVVMRATAYARATQPTAAGTAARKGIVAADPRVLPPGTRIRISQAAGYDGEYLVTDTGSLIKGRHIDLYLPSRAAARQFGSRHVRVEVVEIGAGKEDARQKDYADRVRIARLQRWNAGRPFQR